jgi:hypothetical protein
MQLPVEPAATEPSLSTKTASVVPSIRLRRMVISGEPSSSMPDCGGALPGAPSASTPIQLPATTLPVPPMAWTKTPLIWQLVIRLGSR